MNKKISLIEPVIILGWFIIVLPLFTQPYPTGAVIDLVLYDSIPRKVVQISRSYTSIPFEYSLKQFASIPKFQKYSSCTAWASIYAARTIAESIALNRIDRVLTTQNVFSLLFVYKSVFLYDYNNSNPPTTVLKLISRDYYTWATNVLERFPSNSPSLNVDIFSDPENAGEYSSFPFISCYLTVGAFKDAVNALDVFRRMTSAGYVSFYTSIGDDVSSDGIYAVNISNITPENFQQVIKHLGNLGFKEVFLKFQ
jgi:hypothetical protein